MNLNTVRVFVRDLGAAQPFYSNGLGLRLRGGRADLGYCVFDAGNTQLVVESVPPDAPEEDQVLVGRFTGLSFAVADVEAKHKELLALGVRFTGAPERQAWGGVLATFQDPEGNEMQIAQVGNAV
ncbi:MAG: VOC family protein [Burkholderiales bacterium]